MHNYPKPLRINHHNYKLTHKNYNSCKRKFVAIKCLIKSLDTSSKSLRVITLSWGNSWWEGGKLAGGKNKYWEGSIDRGKRV